MSLYCILFKLFYGLSFSFLPPLYSGLIKSHFLSAFTPFVPSFNFAISIVMADHSRPRHRRKCPACTRFMRSGDNHLHMCRFCHGCTVDNKCDICSRWTHQVWVGIVERSTARHNKKQRVISEAPASDIPSTPPHPALHVRGFTPTGPLRAEHRTLLSGPKPETRSTLRSRRETRKLTPFDSGHRSTGKSRGRTEKTRDSPRCGSCLRAIGENSDLPTAGAEPENRSSSAE